MVVGALVGINDSASPFFGLKQEDFAQAPISAEWDSWVTVGATGFAGNNTDYSPGFLGSNGVDAVVVGNAFWETDGLVFNANPDLPWFGPDVVIAQFTIPGVPGGKPGDPGHNGIHLEGIVAWSQPGAGFTVSPFVVDNLNPCPWDLNGNGNVGFIDLVTLLNAWGPNPGHPADFNGNGFVGPLDLLALLVNWGPCP